MTPIDRELLAPSLAPFGKSTILPAAAYTDESVFRWEQERFFDASWVCVGRAGGLREAGDQRAVSLGHESVLLVRGEDDTLRAFYNVCRHRGHELLPVGGEACGKFVRCPYRAWAYGLDGELKGAPGFGKAGGFERSGLRLVSMRVVEWHGWLFANASGDAPLSTSTPEICGKRSRTTAARSWLWPEATHTRWLPTGRSSPKTTTSATTAPPSTPSSARSAPLQRRRQPGAARVLDRGTHGSL